MMQAMNEDWTNCGAVFDLHSKLTRFIHKMLPGYQKKYDVLKLKCRQYPAIHTTVVQTAPFQTIKI